MAVNKNFVVKNGLEVNSDLIVADATTKNVGIGSTIPSYTLEVVGGIGVTNIYSAGIATIKDKLRVGTGGTVLSVLEQGGFVGVGTTNPVYALDVRTSTGATTGTTVLYVLGDAEITGNLDVGGDIVYDEVTGRNLYIAGLSTFVGMSTFKDGIYVSGVSTFSGDINIAGSAGVTSVRWDQSQQSIEFLDETKATFGTNNDLQISHTNSLKDQDDSEGNSVVDGWTSYIEEQGTGGLVFKSDGNSGEGAYQFFDTSWRPILRLFSGASARAVLYHAGLDRFETTGIGITVHGSVGILTDLSVGGMVTATTYHGDGSNLTGIATGLSATIGIQSGTTYIGSGLTTLGVSGGSATVTPISSGIATITLPAAGVSLGLAIALGG